MLCFCWVYFAYAAVAGSFHRSSSSVVSAFDVLLAMTAMHREIRTH